MPQKLLLFLMNGTCQLKSFLEGSASTHLTVNISQKRGHTEAQVYSNVHLIARMNKEEKETMNKIQKIAG